MKKSKITHEQKNGYWRRDFYTDDPIDLAIYKAYRDLMRTISGISKNEHREDILRKAKTSLKTSIQNILNTKITDSDDFDALHKKACLDLQKAFKGQTFTVGQAQKWLNMTFKYLFLLDYKEMEKIYEYCHVPVDRYILRAEKDNTIKSWSKLDDYEVYMNFQDKYRINCGDEIPLDVEFEKWIMEVKKEHKSILLD